MRLKILAAVLGFAAISVPAAAMAGVVIESANIPTQSVSFNYGFTLPSFDTSLGALQSVEFILSESATASVAVTNITGSDLSFTNATASIPLSVSGGGLSVTDNITAGPVDGVALANTVTSFSGLTGMQTADATFTSGLAAFEQAPPVNVSFMANAGNGTYSGTGPSGQLFFGGSAMAGGTFEIVYNYASVPEPATWAFLLLGVAGIGAAMRRGRKGGLALATA